MRLSGTINILNMNVDQKHILVVDDEEHLAIGIKFNLEAEGYVVTAVAVSYTHLTLPTKA